MMMEPQTDNRCGVSSVDSHQVDEAPGPTPRKGPPQATGGTSASSRGARRGGQQEKATGQTVETQKKPLNIIQWNCEGIYHKKDALKDTLTREEIDIVCLQETHLTPSMRFNFRGYQNFRKDREHARKGGVLTLVTNKIPAQEIKVQDTGESEIVGVQLKLPDRTLVVYNCYAPPDKALMLQVAEIPEEDCVVLGDFNSHSPSWGYRDLDAKGEELEDWQTFNKLHLLNKPDDPPTFYSRAWKTTSHPDLTFATNNIMRGATRQVLPQLATSDHKPIKISVQVEQPGITTSTLPRWNYKKADWAKFSALTDTHTAKINTKSSKVNRSNREFTKAILWAAKESIPRGARKEYIPNWSQELKQLNDQVTIAREIAEQHPTTDNNIELKKASANFRKATCTAIRKSWHEKTDSLNMDRQGKKMWNLVQSLNGEKKNRNAPVMLVKDGEQKIGKQAANVLIEQYKTVGNLALTPERVEEVQKEIENFSAPQEPADGIMTKPITMPEMDRALLQLKPKQAPGPDKISNDMLLHLGNPAKKKLLQIFNASWKSGKIPKAWKSAIQIPVLKQGKPQNKAESYRPISLTSCLCKLFERILNYRLVWYLEKNHLLTDAQAGFRKHRSTEDQVTYITQQIEDSFQKKEHTVAVWIDLEKAFDKVWTEGLILKLMKNKISHNMLKWITQYLTHRRACVKLQGARSKMETISNGVPQGGVLSATLFLIFMNDIET